MKIAFFETTSQDRRYFEASSLSEHSLSFWSRELEREDSSSLRDVRVLSVFIYSRIDADFIDQLQQLQMIATRSTGFDHIDLDRCRERNIVVANVPEYGDNTVAEHAFALILSLSRKIHTTHQRTARSDFSREGLEGFDLKAKTLGLVGCGSIGLRVAMIGRGFGMRVLVYDPAPQDLYRELIGFEYTTMEHMLAESDIVSLHCPHNKHTHHLMNRERLDAMKKGAILINTARGGLVDTEALLYALDRGQIGGAGLDVLEGEDAVQEEWQLVARQQEFSDEIAKTLLRNHLLVKRDDVIVTPHNAFNSREARLRILDTTVRNIEAFEQGRPLNIVSNG